MRKQKTLIWLAATILLNSFAYGAAPVTIQFVEPERYRDVRIDGNENPSFFGNVMTPFLEKKMGELLPEGFSLEINYTQIDLAGDFEPWRGVDFQDVRVMREIYVPRLEFTYTLVDDQGELIKEGKSRLVDLNYLENRNPLRAENDVLYHEKRMMERWMKRELARL